MKPNQMVVAMVLSSLVVTSVGLAAQMTCEEVMSHAQQLVSQAHSKDLTMRSEAEAKVDQLLAIATHDMRAGKKMVLEKVENVDNLIRNVESHPFLQVKVKELGDDAVSGEITKLAMLTRQLEPGDKGGIKQALVKFGIGRKVLTMVERYGKIETQVTASLNSLWRARNELKEDNVKIEKEADRAFDNIYSIEDQLKQSELFQEILERRIAEMNISDQERGFFRNEIIYPLTKRIQELHDLSKVNNVMYTMYRGKIDLNTQAMQNADNVVRQAAQIMPMAITAEVTNRRTQRVTDATGQMSDSMEKMLVEAGKRYEAVTKAVTDQAGRPALSEQSLSAFKTSVDNATNLLQTYKQQQLVTLAERIERQKAESEVAQQLLTQYRQTGAMKPLLALEKKDGVPGIKDADVIGTEYVPVRNR